MPENQQFKLKYMQILPEFNGNQSLLNEFISTSKQLINKFYSAQDANHFQNLLLKSIKNKIKGEAADHTSSYQIKSWNDLKRALLATYADKRDLHTLTIELCNLRQVSNLIPLEFFTRVQENLNLQISYISTQVIEAARDVLIQNCNCLALRVFLKHLNNPLGHYLSTRQPSTLSEVLKILTNHFNVNDKSKFTKPSVNYNRFNPTNYKPSPQPQQNFNRQQNFTQQNKTEINLMYLNREKPFKTGQFQ